MPARQHYANAPIVEALIDIQVTPSEQMTSKRLNALAEQLAERLPHRREITELATTVQLDAQNIRGLTVMPNLAALRLENAERNQVAILRAEGFTFSLLAPYSRWETLRDQARQVWNPYRAVCQPKNITRIAVRYINRLDLPKKLSDLSEYIRVVPSLPSAFPGGKLGDYVLRFQAPQEDLEAVLIVHTGRVPPPSEQADALSIILDFDLYRDLSASPWDIAEEPRVWEYLESLHERKNTVFEASITDKTRERIQ